MDEDRKIESGVFDEYTKKTIYKLQNKGYFETLDFPISTGKEADVYRGTTKNEEHIAVKIYRIETSKFREMRGYLAYDPRFEEIKPTKRGLVEEWCKKEYKNLRDAREAGVRCPKPIKTMKNVLLMEYIGLKDGSPAPMLKNADPENPEKTMETIERYIDLMYEEAGIVHSDLSEFNVLIQDQEPVIIDMGQAVSVKHPRAQDFLERDRENIKKFTRKIK